MQIVWSVRRALNARQPRRYDSLRSKIVAYVAESRSVTLYNGTALDTSITSPVGDLMLNILASFAQFERALIAERARVGTARARRQGKHVGRPLVLNGNLEPLLSAIRSGRCQSAPRPAAWASIINSGTRASRSSRRGCGGMSDVHLATRTWPKHHPGSNRVKPHW